jgi:hypothetical protein
MGINFTERTCEFCTVESVKTLKILLYDYLDEIL